MHRKKGLLILLIAVPVFFQSMTKPAETRVLLSAMNMKNMRQGYGGPQVNKITEKAFSIANQSFQNGVATVPRSVLWINLAEGSKKFVATVGIDDSSVERADVVKFKVLGDGKKLWDSGEMKYGQQAKHLELDVKRVKELVLIVNVINNYNRVKVQAVWADAFFVVTGKEPQTIASPREDAVILTPKPAAAPKINGPKVYGCRPFSPFLFRIPATGNRPMQFRAENLPPGLKLDETSGIITGKIESRGEYNVILHAKNDKGETSRPFKVSCGDKLALTPTMGWNDWYSHYDHITDVKMREAADIMLKSGMADAGYDYVNIDDCWMNGVTPRDTSRIGPSRDASGNILPNKYFPDMKGLTGYIHSKGLKAGIYTSPGPLTCAGHTGSLGHAAQDAKQFADWGFDLLKYDWCSYEGIYQQGPQTMEMVKKPYREMGAILRSQERDIIYNLCYAKNEVWKWGEEVGGHSWRTAFDLGGELYRVFEVALNDAEYREWSKPGSWNDADYLQIGYVNAKSPRPSYLTPGEQYSFMSLWALIASPLIYSGDLSRLDDFTLNILCNSEVIDVNQDALGKSADVIKRSEDTFVMIKELEDGSKAIGLVNSGEGPSEISIAWKEAGMPPGQMVRDLWRQKDLGTFKKEFKVTVPRRSVFLIKASKAQV